MEEEILISETDISFDQFAPKELNEGEIVRARIVEVTEKDVIVDLGLKTEGIIPREEFLHPVSINEEISVFLRKKGTVDGHPQVSYREVQLMKTREKLDETFRENSVLEASIDHKVKGGFLVNLKFTPHLCPSPAPLNKGAGFNPLDIQAFLPVGEIVGSYNEINRLNTGEKIKVKIIEMTQNNKNVVVSGKKYFDDFLKNLKEDDIVRGKVAKITDFGAFLGLEDGTNGYSGVKGLLHISDISWNRVGKVGNILKLDEEIKVKVNRIDREKRQISLSLKELTPHPWESVEKKYPVSSIVSGKVTSLTKFGAFVELEQGVEGLLHLSELSWASNLKEPGEVVKVGQVLKLQILAVDREKEKISLSLKRTLTNPWEEAKIKYPSGTKVSGEVTHLTPFGAFVKLPIGIEGLIHISDFSWTKKIKHPREFVKVGDQIETVIIEVFPEKEKIVLGLKQLTPDPYAKYQPGMSIQGKVSGINDFGVFLELTPGIEGMIHYSEIFLPKGKNLKETFKIGETIAAKIIRVSPAERKISLSIKRYEKEKEWQEISKYFDPENSKVTLGEIIEPFHKSET